MNEITRFDLDMDEQLTDCVPEGAQIIEHEDDRNRVSLTRQQLHEFVAYVAKLREKNGYGI